MKGIINDVVILLIFQDLLDAQKDENIEAACLLINSIGYAIDDKLSSMKRLNKKKPNSKRAKKI